MGLPRFGRETPQQLCFLSLSQLSLFFDILLCMARNVSREDFLAGRPPEMGQRDTDVEGYLRVARAKLWRELRDQPLTMGGCCLSAPWVGRPQSEDPLPRDTRLPPAWSLGSWARQA